MSLKTQAANLISKLDAVRTPSSNFVELTAAEYDVLRAAALGLAAPQEAQPTPTDEAVQKAIRAADEFLQSSFPVNHERALALVEVGTRVHERVMDNAAAAGVPPREVADRAFRALSTLRSMRQTTWPMPAPAKSSAQAGDRLADLLFGRI